MRRYDSIRIARTINLRKFGRIVLICLLSVNRLHFCKEYLKIFAKRKWKNLSKELLKFRWETFKLVYGKLIRLTGCDKLSTSIYNLVCKLTVFCEIVSIVKIILLSDAKSSESVSYNSQDAAPCTYKLSRATLYLSRWWIERRIRRARCRITRIFILMQVVICLSSKKHGYYKLKRRWNCERLRKFRE